MFDPWRPTVIVPQTADPNDILGPDGIGAERWISAANPINYTIRFENDPILANAPAQFVLITQTLDPDLDPRSIRLGSFGFGSFIFSTPADRALYSTRLDVRSTYGVFVDVLAGVDIAAGTLFWQFTAIDPLTNERPVDRFIGFLPPNVNRPEGDGFVSYSVRARRTAPTGARVDAEARIFFDENAPIDTPPIFNTLDANGPATAVGPLPPNQVDSRFRVRWFGDDGSIGVGLATYDVYVSVNGGPYALWLAKTEQTEAEYLGEFGNSYSFYSLGTDKVGQVERKSPLAESTIVIGSGASVWDGEAGDKDWFNPRNWSGDRVPGQTDIVTIPEEYAGGTIFVSGPDVRIAGLKFVGTLDVRSSVFTVTGNAVNEGELKLDARTLFQVNGSYVQSGRAQLTTTMGGVREDQSGRLSVAGTASLAGTLRVNFAPGFVPRFFDTANVVIAGALLGRFDALQSQQIDFGKNLVLYTGTTARFVVSTVADFDSNGQVDFFDYLSFIDAFGRENPSADFNGNGVIDFFDYLDFVEWFRRF